MAEKFKVYSKKPLFFLLYLNQYFFVLSSGFLYICELKKISLMTQHDIALVLMMQLKIKCPHGFLSKVTNVSPSDIMFNTLNVFQSIISHRFATFLPGNPQRWSTLNLITWGPWSRFRPSSLPTSESTTRPPRLGAQL